jgi:hypothetical protein
MQHTRSIVLSSLHPLQQPIDNTHNTLQAGQITAACSAVVDRRPTPPLNIIIAAKAEADHK